MSGDKTRKTNTPKIENKRQAEREYKMTEETKKGLETLQNKKTL